MSTSKTRQRSSSPIDQDLQQLYEQVWAGFDTEDPPPSTEKDIDTIYSVYGEANDRDYPARMPSTCFLLYSTTTDLMACSTADAETGSIEQWPTVRRRPQQCVFCMRIYSFPNIQTRFVQFASAFDVPQKQSITIACTRQWQYPQAAAHAR